MSDERFTHAEWIGLLQPVGVVAAPPALEDALAFIDRARLADDQRAFRDLALPSPDDDPERARVTDLTRLLRDVLGWRDDDCIPAAQLPDSLRVPLPEYREELSPTWATSLPEDPERYVILALELPRDVDLDTRHGDSDHGWNASPHARFERLLRETRVPIGLLSNETSLRLVYAPTGEATGHVTFPYPLLARTAGRVALGALRALLHADRVFTAPEKQRLPHILRESRRFQGRVSNTLAQQVLDALWELLRGFQSADTLANGRVLRTALEHGGAELYGGLLTVLLRLVFLLYAEDQGTLPGDGLYARSYGLAGLYERLREDAGAHPDTLDLRFGAWGQLLALFRLIHDGGGHGPLSLPPRYGDLFDPTAHPFLEGRDVPPGTPRNALPFEVPRVSDGVVWRVLSKLMVIDGERISYRTLDVEQLGSVYESMVGFTVERAVGASLALKPDDVVVDLDALLRTAPNDRLKSLKSLAGASVSGASAEALRSAATTDALATALERARSHRTPAVLPLGSVYLQPTAERRRSGTHYTPRALTEPIVHRTLDAVLPTEPAPTPEAVLAMRVCDPAMGSGAFLVAACRWLGDRLVRAWAAHGGRPTIAAGDDETLVARRLVAQRCLYGVDRNPFAVGLARLSLWLVTLAKDHPFTFVDPNLRHGDSLVGLDRDQVLSVSFELAGFEQGATAKRTKKSRDEAAQVSLLRPMVVNALARSRKLREEIADLAMQDDVSEKRFLHDQSRHELREARALADAMVEVAFASGSAKDKKTRLESLRALVETWTSGGDATPIAQESKKLHERGVVPFHWPLEFPEVFSDDRGGFDAIVGNPPFAGKNTLIAGNADGYLDWLLSLHEESHGNADLVAHFFRRAFHLLRAGGAFGLIATNTISQGDTRSTGLRYLTTHGATIFAATKRLKWPLEGAAVVVSVVHAVRGTYSKSAELDGRTAERITAFLVDVGDNVDPLALHENAGRSFIGTYVLGSGFIFDDSKAATGETTDLATMHRLIKQHPNNAERIQPYLGGEELNTSPTQSHHRYVINFGQMTESEARQWPDLLSILETKVKGKRGAHATSPWWQHERPRTELYQSLQGRDRVLCTARVSTHLSFAWQPTGRVFMEKLVVFPYANDSTFSVLQSRIHELWTRFFSSTMKDDLNYAPSDCFETFPFPAGWEASAALEDVGKRYDAARGQWMVAHDEGLTKFYNRFHDPDESDPGVLALRELHAEMDRAVLDAYGWTDLAPMAGFVLAWDDGAEGDDDAPRRGKRPWRLRWSDADHDAVLGRLLALNAERARSQ